MNYSVFSYTYFNVPPFSNTLNKQIYCQSIYCSPIYCSSLINCDKNITCPISFINIAKSYTYCKCTQCKFNFDADALQHWININNTCPMCRTQWKNNIIYINKRNEME